jgi:hypothetical protein
MFSKLKQIPLKNSPKITKNKPQKNKKGSLNFSIFTLFLIITGVVGFGSWLGLSLILDPNGILWINRYLPKALQIPRALPTPPQTLTAIEEEAKKDNLTPGEPITVGSEVIIPFSRILPSCTCQSIVELKVYALNTSEGNTETYYRLITQLSIPDFTEAFVTGEAERLNAVALTEFAPSKTAPNLGYWFNLQGKISQNQTNIFYGNLINYNPQDKKLAIILPWKSLAGKSPSWEKVTNNSYPDLVIDQTTDFIPRFQVYQLPVNLNTLEEYTTIKLTEIDLKQPALTRETYRKTIEIAQKGLWSAALEQLEQIKKDLGNQWTIKAQDQMDVITFHAKISNHQCQQQQPNLQDQIINCLYAGKATEALVAFEPPVTGGRKEIVEAITQLLEADQPGFWQWIENRLKLTPNDDNIKVWGTLLLALQRGRKDAIKWLNELPETSQDLIIKTEQLLDQVDLVINNQVNHSLHVSQIMGIGKPLENVDLANWLKPPGVEQLDSITHPQVWYQIDVLNFYNGKELVNIPLENLQLSKLAPAQQLWRLLGLDFDPRISIITKKDDGSQEITLGMVKALNFDQGYLQLLATGVTVENTKIESNGVISLVNSNGAVEWLNPESTELTKFVENKPVIFDQIFPYLQESLIAQGYFSSDEIAEVSQFITIMEKLSVEEIDLIGDSQAEIMIKFYKNEAGKLTAKDSQSDQKQLTVIFSGETGEIIYNELGDLNQGNLVAIARLKGLDGVFQPVLIIQQGEKYSLQKL